MLTIKEGLSLMSDVYEKTELKYQSDIKELQQNIEELQRKLRYSFGSRLLSKVNRMMSKS